MRTTSLVVPILPKEEWTKLSEAYPIPPHEHDLVAWSGRSGQRIRLTREEFLAIAMWKSPRPKPLYELNSGDDVHQVTEAAFSSQNDTEKVVELSRLTGINVRSATAILHMSFPVQFPILDFRAVAALGVGQEESSKWGELQWLRTWKPYVRICLIKSLELGMSLRQFDRALWVRGGGRTTPANEAARSGQFTDPPQMESAVARYDSDYYKGLEDGKSGNERSGTGTLQYHKGYSDAMQAEDRKPE